MYVPECLQRKRSPCSALFQDANKIIYERLQKEFEDARASQTQGTSVVYWCDTSSPSSFVHCGSLVTSCLEGARIGKLYEISYAGETCDLYHCVLESKSFLEKMTVLEHTIPYFLPIREVENGLLSSNAMKLIDYIGEILQAYVDRREQVCCWLIKVVVKLKYAELVSVLPNHVSVVAWPVCQPRKSSPNISSMNKKEKGTLEGPTTLFYAEDALRTMSLPKGILSGW
ncbi:unnamed protein product [Malus baccata var. baccata]